MSSRLPGYDEYLSRLVDEEMEDEEEDDDNPKYDQDYYDDFFDDDNVCDQFWSPD